MNPKNLASTLKFILICFIAVICCGKISVACSYNKSKIGRSLLIEYININDFSINKQTSVLCKRKTVNSFNAGFDNVFCFRKKIDSSFDLFENDEPVDRASIKDSYFNSAYNIVRRSLSNVLDAESNFNFDRTVTTVGYIASPTNDTDVCSELPFGRFFSASYKSSSGNPQSKSSEEKKHSKNSNDAVGNLKLIAQNRREPLGALFAGILCLGLAFPIGAWGADRWDGHRRLLGVLGLGLGLCLGIDGILGPLLGLDLYSLWWRFL